MNILHLRYVIEVDRTRSVSKAADNLFMNQSNLSRSIRELEQSLGITLFKRTSKGMTPTPQGEEFLARAKEIVAKIDEVERLYKKGEGKTRFALSAPRADYIATALARWVSELSLDPIEVYYKETNATDTVNDLLQGEFRLGIIRYQVQFDDRFKALLHEKDILSESLGEYPCQILVAADDPLAQMETVSVGDLKSYTQVSYPDNFVPSLPLTDALRAEAMDGVERHLYVHDRGGLMELLSKVPHTFACLPALSRDQLSRYRLAQLPLSDGEKLCRDLLIYRKGYHLTPLERRFVELLHAQKAVSGT